MKNKINLGPFSNRMSSGNKNYFSSDLIVKMHKNSIYTNSKQNEREKLIEEYEYLQSKLFYTIYIHILT